MWEQLPFYLPRIRIDFPKAKDDYILLTPRNLLTRDDTWINQSDLIKSFSEIRYASTNEVLRGSINNYFLKRLPDMPTNTRHQTGGAKSRGQAYSSSGYRKAVQETIRQFPILIRVVA